MINHYDLLYGAGVGLAAPFWLSKPSARKKVLAAFSCRMGRVPGRDLSKPAVMIHAVSLGEINATRALVDLLRTDWPGIHFIISTTTETGFARGKVLYDRQTDVTLVRYPLDFSPAVERLLDTLRPRVVALMELEVWPNFIRKCFARKVPVLLINGRITTHSFDRFKMARPLIAPMFRRLSSVCAQEQTYADRFIALGAPAERVQVTGTMKFDTAPVSDGVAGADELARTLELPGDATLWVCGSTGPGEEELVLSEYGKLLATRPQLRLAIIPRKPERFDEVAALIAARGFAVTRLSQRRSADRPPVDPRSVILGDTIGDLRKFFSLATVVFVGRSLVDLGAKQHGSDMIEPAALGKPIVVGPFTGNFAEPMACFVADNAMIVVNDGELLGRETAALLADPQRAASMGQRAKSVVAHQRGATQRHAAIIVDELRKVVVPPVPSPAGSAVSAGEGTGGT